MKSQQTLKVRPWWLSAALLAITPVLGILVRFGHLGLPWSVQKYGGSVLWAAMVYWTVSTVLVGARPPIAAGAAEIVAVAVEYVKRMHTPALERFRATLAGVLLLGKQFSYTDLVAYTVAILCACAIDVELRRRFGRKAKSV